MNRLEKVREYVDDQLRCIPDIEFRRAGFVHIYGVAQACVMLAERRGEDPELAAVAGMLHDIYTYTAMNSFQHAHKGAVLAGTILRAMKVFQEEEIEKITHAIYHHTDKEITDEPFDELLKDADVIAHSFYDPGQPVQRNERVRYAAIRKEFGMGPESTIK